MEIKLKTFIVSSLENLCELTHWVNNIPVLKFFASHKLAAFSARLDERWQTDLWKKDFNG